MSASSVIVAWMMSVMMFWSPPDRPHFIPEAKETKEEAVTRYEEIAKALFDVTYDPDIEPIMGGKYGRAQTSILILSLAFMESGYRRDVDLGIGKEARGDNGKSHCMLQILTGKDLNNTTLLQNAIGKKWSGLDLTNDRRKCFYAGYRMALASFKRCRHLPFKQRLAQYATGSCNAGLLLSEARVNPALKWYSTHVAPLADEVVLAERRQQVQAGGIQPAVYHP